METCEEDERTEEIWEFKSYYVVWKLLRFLFLLRWYIRLNRTMQYGNGASVDAVPTQEEEFKSYYVVWKPLLIFGFKCRYGCLNRTMQYGNHQKGISI